MGKGKYILPVLSAIGFHSPIAAQQTTKLNVLYIMSDDLNSDMGSFDDSLVQTPNLDRLREHAVRFKNAYTQFPLSGPSRASILTGLYPEHTHVHDLNTFFRDSIPNVVTLPQLFKEKGYKTIRVGKIFHANVPYDIGTSGQDDSASWNVTYNPIGRDRTEEEYITNYTPQFGLGRGMSFREIDATDDELTDGISANVGAYLIKQNKDKPFFLAIGFYRPHTPYVAPKKYFTFYPLDKISLPYVPEDDWKNKPIYAKFTDPLNWGLSETQLKEVKRAYYASISFMDAQIGKLLDALEKENLLDKTIILFQSDHGYNLGQHGQWQKRSLFEHCANTPLIISVPGVTESKETTNNVVEFVDIYPTIAKAAGLSNLSTNLDGKDLLPVLREPLKDTHEVAYTTVLRKQTATNTAPYMKMGESVWGRSIRDGRFRYTEWDEGRKGGELYDYQNDSHEFNNLYNNPKYKKVQAELRQKLHAKYK